MRSTANVRGAYVVEYLVVVGALVLVVAAGLAYISGPMLYLRFRHDQRALASPIP